MKFFRTHKTLLLSLGFLVLFSVTVSYATPPGSPYAAGATLDPGCAPGTANCFVESGLPISGGTLTGTTTFAVAPVLSSFTAGSIPFVGNAGVLSQDNNGLFYDNTGHGLGLGTNSLIAKLTIKGDTIATPSSYPFGSYDAFGDSITFGINASTPSNNYVNLLGTAIGLTAVNHGISGDQAADQTGAIYQTAVSSSSSQLFTYMLGTNDLANYGLDVDKKANYQSIALASTVWLAIPSNKKFTAQSGTPVYSGAWTNSSYYGGAIGKYSTTNGDTATFTTTGTVAYIAYTMLDGNGGTFSVTVDGVSKGNFNNFGKNNTLISTINAKSVYGSGLARITGLTSGTHTVVLTVTSATSPSNQVIFDWAAGNSGVNTAGGPRVIQGLLPQRIAGDPITSYNVLVNQNVANMQSDGLNVFAANTAYVLDLVTDFSPSNPTHPNDSGMAHLEQAFLSAINNNSSGRFQNSLAVTSSAGNQFVVSSGGFVGIGTSLPGYTLDIATTNANDRGLNIVNSASTGSVNYGANIQSIGAGVDTNVALSLSATGGAKNYALYAPSGFSFFGERVGLGTDAPTASLTFGSTTSGIVAYNTPDQTTNFELYRQAWINNVYTFTTDETGGTGISRPIAIKARSSILNIGSTQSGFSGFFDFNRGSGGTQGTISTNGAYTNTTGSPNFIAITNTVNQSGSAGYAALKISPFEQATGSGNKYLIDAGTNTAASGTGVHTSLFTVNDVGTINLAGRAGIGFTGTVPVASLQINPGSYSTNSTYSTAGFGIQMNGTTYTSTTSSGTIASTGVNTFGIPTLAASSATTLTNAATLYVDGAPTAGSGVTITNPLALYVNNGFSSFGQRVGIGTTAPTSALTFSSGAASGITLYNTADQTTNFERVREAWAGNVFTIVSEGAGTGTSRPLALTAASATLAIGSAQSGLSGFFDFNRGSGGTQGTISTNGTYTNATGSPSFISITNTVNQSGTGGYAALKISPFEQATGSGARYLIDAGTNSAAGGTGTHSSKFVVNSAGLVGIGTTTLTYTLNAGSAAVSGIVARFQNSTGTCDINPTATALSCSSDMNLKKNITVLADGGSWSFNNNITADNQSVLSRLLALTPVAYNWNTEATTDAKHTGFIAQDVKQLFPDLVTEDPDTHLLSLNYMGMIPYTVEALKELNLNATAIADLDRPNTWREAIVSWLGSAGNGIQDIFSKKVTTEKVQTDQLCVGTVCITQDQFLHMVQGNNGSTTVQSAPSQPQEEVSEEGPAEQTPEVQEPEVSVPASNPVEPATDTAE